MRTPDLAEPPTAGSPTGHSGMPNFAREHKSEAGYLDVAANAHGAEKGLLVHRALGRVDRPQPHVVEIGPGGGAAVDYLAAQLADAGQDWGGRLTLIEAPGLAELERQLKLLDRPMASLPYRDLVLQYRRSADAEVPA